MIEFIKEGDQNILSLEQKKMWNKWTVSYKMKEMETWQKEEEQISWEKMTAILEQTILSMKPISNFHEKDGCNDKPLDGVQKSVEERIIDKIYEKGLIK